MFSDCTKISTIKSKKTLDLVKPMCYTIIVKGRYQSGWLTVQVSKVDTKGSNPNLPKKIKKILKKVLTDNKKSAIIQM